MKVDCEWNNKLSFTANIDRFRVNMDGTRPFGDGLAPSPKQLLLSALCGCTGMDVMALLNKNKQVPYDFRIEALADTEENHPHELINIKLNYVLNGPCEPDKVMDAVRLSQTKYCAISSMISRGTDVDYNVFLNGKLLAGGRADFHEIAHQYSPASELNV